MKTYTVQAVRSGGWWVLTVPEVPGAVSQVRSLASAEEHIREAITFVAGVAPDAFAVQVVPQLPDTLTAEVTRARAAAAAAEQAQATASTLTRDVVGKLAAAGYNGRETAAILGLSKQRVSQLSAPSGQPNTRTQDANPSGRGRAKHADGTRRIPTSK